MDPEDNRIQLVQALAHLPSVPLNTLSSHVKDVGFIVHDRAREDSFFRDVLGFKPYWYGGMRDDLAHLDLAASSEWHRLA